MKSSEPAARREAKRQKRHADRTDPELLTQLRQAIGRIDTALNHFEQVVDPTLIDCYIYELNAAQLRYQFLLRRIKSQEQSFHMTGGNCHEHLV